MGDILAETLAKANTKPISGVVVGIPGSFISEHDEFPMKNTENIMGVAKQVKKKYGSMCFGFRRCYYLHGKRHFVDPGWVYLTGVIETLRDLRLKNDPKEEVLRSNMEFNNIDKIIRIDGHHYPFTKDDVLLVVN